MGSKVPPNSAMFIPQQSAIRQSAVRDGASPSLLWRLLGIVLHLVGILDKEHGLPDVVIRQHTVPARHGSVAYAVLDDIEKVAVGIVGGVAHQLRYRWIKLRPHLRSGILQAAVTQGAVLV